jgi:hypothetical protein
VPLRVRVQRVEGEGVVALSGRQYNSLVQTSNTIPQRCAAAVCLGPSSE